MRGKLLQDMKQEEIEKTRIGYSQYYAFVKQYNYSELQTRNIANMLRDRDLPLNRMSVLLVTVNPKLQF